MALNNKSVSAVPQVVSALPPETYLAIYLSKSFRSFSLSYRWFSAEHLSTNPIRTKAITSGTLSALQEFLASYIAGDKSPSGSYVTSRVPKMAVYGVCRILGSFVYSRLLFPHLLVMVVLCVNKLLTFSPFSFDTDSSTCLSRQDDCKGQSSTDPF